MTFADCLAHCADTPELVQEFNRLTGRNLGQSSNRTPLEVAIDEATGHPGESEEDMQAFIAFVYEFIWLRMVATEETEGG